MYYNLLDKIVPMRDVFAEQIMMICLAIFGQHDPGYLQVWRGGEMGTGTT